MTNRMRNLNCAVVSRETLLPRADRVRRRMVADARATLLQQGLQVERIGRRRWYVDGLEMGTQRMVALAQGSRRGAEASSR